MKLDPVLLRMAASWSLNAYKEENDNAIKIENKFTGATAFIAKRKTIDIVAFRGTQKKLNDILTDLCVVPVPYAGRLCHAGFVIQHRSIWKEILQHIDPNKRTLFTGHSLAGALASLSCSKLRKHTNKNLNLVTFGKPNVYFKGFKRPMYLDNQVSCVHAGDIVAYIPRFCYGPSVSQTMLYFANNGTTVVDPDERFKKTDRGNLKKRVENHSMQGYVERVEEYIAQRELDAKKVSDIKKKRKAKKESKSETKSSESSNTD